MSESVTTPASCAPDRPQPDAHWWRQAVVYQVYPRSFADGNGDGVGDFVGLISRVPYLQRLGVDAVWLSPFYPSALADGGYDVDDYRDVDPRIGTLDDFDRLIAAVHGAGMRLIVDLVPNHSSNRHELFQEALAAGPGAPERERYIFRDGRGVHGELAPTDWQSLFGGPAWTRVPDGQWYLHLFAPEQPDFNWKNRDVRAEFEKTLRFWSDRGVDGFRVDVAHALAKDVPDPLPARLLDQDYPDGRHPLWDRDEVHEIYAEWRSVFEEYSPPRIGIAETWLPAQRRMRYARPDGLGQAFNFDLLKAEWDRDQFHRVIAENLDLADASGASSTWVFSNHDVIRHATRFGLTDEPAEVGMLAGTREDDDLPTLGRQWLRDGGPADREDRVVGLARARAATLVALALPGSAYLYQGEELGLPEVAGIPADERQDPTYFRTAGRDIGRDGCRVPLPWTSGGSSFGFGAHGSHLPQPDWFSAYAVEAQDGIEGSTLELYRRALALRRELQGEEVLTWLELGEDVLAFERPGGWVCVTNLGTGDVDLPPGSVLLRSRPGAEGVIAPDTTVWLRR